MPEPIVTMTLTLILTLQAGYYMDSSNTDSCLKCSRIGKDKESANSSFTSFYVAVCQQPRPNSNPNLSES